MIRRRFIRTVFASVAGLLGLPACRPRMPLFRCWPLYGFHILERVIGDAGEVWCQGRYFIPDV